MRKTVGLLCLLLCLSLFPFTGAAEQEMLPAAPEIVLRFGVVGDLCLGDDAATTLRSGTAADRFAVALDEMANAGIDALVLAGDLIADGLHGGTIAEGEWWQLTERIDAAFPEGLPLVWTLGEQDGDAETAARFLGVSVTEVAGFPFLTVEGSYDEDIYYTEHTLTALEEALRECAATYAGKPIFVVTHATVADTTAGSFWCGSEELTAVLEHYPQVILFAGHTRSPLFSERSIMQGAFTAVDVGTFDRLRLPGTGFVPQGRDRNEHGLLLPAGCDAAEGLLVEVDATGAVRIIRRDFLKHEDIGAAWDIPAPDLEEKSHLARYTAARGETAVPPQFPAGAEMTAVQDADGRLRLTVPVAEGSVQACRFYVEEADRTLVYKAYLPFWKYPQPEDRPAALEITLPVTSAVRPCRVIAEPLDEWGNAGERLSCLWVETTAEDRLAAAAVDAAIDAVGVVSVDSGEIIARAAAAYEALTAEQKLLTANGPALRAAEARYDALFACEDELRYAPDAGDIRDPGSWKSLSVTEGDDGVRVEFDRVVGNDVRTFGGRAYALDGLHLLLRRVTGDGVALALTDSGTATRYDAGVRLVITADGTAAWLSAYGEPVARQALVPLGDTADIRFEKTEEGWICTVNGQILPLDTDYVEASVGTQVYVQFFALPDLDPALSEMAFTVTALHGGDDVCAVGERLPRPNTKPTTAPTIVVTTASPTASPTTRTGATTVTAAPTTASTTVGTLPTAPSSSTRPTGGNDRVIPLKAALGWMGGLTLLFGVILALVLLTRRERSHKE